MKLSKQQFHGNPFWDQLKSHILCNINNCRNSNDSATLSHEETQFLRGKIAALKSILALEEKAPE